MLRLLHGYWIDAAHVESIEDGFGSSCLVRFQSGLTVELPCPAEEVVAFCNEDDDPYGELGRSLYNPRRAVEMARQFTEWFDSHVFLPPGWTVDRLDGGIVPPAEHAMGCPDGGTCHHGCTTVCWRVGNAGPLSGIYPDDRWPDDLLPHIDDTTDPHPGRLAPARSLPTLGTAFRLCEGRDESVAMYRAVSLGENCLDAAVLPHEGGPPTIRTFYDLDWLADHWKPA